MQPLGSSDDSDIEKSGTEITNPDIHFWNAHGLCTPQSEGQLCYTVLQLLHIQNIHQKASSVQGCFTFQSCEETQALDQHTQVFPFALLSMLLLQQHKRNHLRHSDGRGEKTFMWCSTTALSLCPLPAFFSLEQDLTDTFLMNTTPIHSTFERSTALVRARNISLPHLTSEKTHFHSLTATCRSFFSFCKYRINDLKQKKWTALTENMMQSEKTLSMCILKLFARQFLRPFYTERVQKMKKWVQGEKTACVLLDKALTWGCSQIFSHSE